MKKLILFAFISALLFSACKKAAKDEEFGFAKLYMPQATVQSAGLNNNYFVYIKNYKTADTTILVGLYRSGLQPLTSVNVSLSVDQDTLAKAIVQSMASGASSNLDVYKTAKLLPQAYYTMPNSIGLNDGQRESYVGLVVNKTLLEADPDYGVKSFILPVRISNPTKFELNPKLSLTMFIFQKKIN